MNSQVKSVSSTCVSASITGMVSNLHPDCAARRRLRGFAQTSCTAGSGSPVAVRAPARLLRALRLKLAQAEFLGLVAPYLRSAHPDPNLLSCDVADVAVHAPSLVQLEDRQD